MLLLSLTMIAGLLHARLVSPVEHVSGTATDASSWEHRLGLPFQHVPTGWDSLVLFTNAPDQHIVGIQIYLLKIEEQ